MWIPEENAYGSAMYIVDAQEMSTILHLSKKTCLLLTELK